MPLSNARRSRPLTLAAVAIAGAALLGACGDDDGSATSADRAPAAEPVVEIERSRFAPEELTVGVGDEVEWVNLDPFAHTVTSSDASSVAFDSGQLGEDEMFVQAFDEAGTYDYFCQIHPTMRASVIVE